MLLVCGWYGEERKLMREGLRRIGMDGGDKRIILRFLESSGGRQVFRFLGNTVILKRL